MGKLKHCNPNFVAGLSLWIFAKKATWPVSHEEHQLLEKKRGGAAKRKTLIHSRSVKKAVPQAETVAESARKLQSAADKTHHEADELHHAIHQMHMVVKGMHTHGDRSGPAEAGELVTREPIVQKAVESMGGSVGVESTLGQGSKFWLQLPRGGQ